VFSPFSPIAANNQRDPNSPFALGDELVFHDQLFANGKQVGDDVGSCVIAPQLLANCSLVIRLPEGNLAGQFVAIQGPEPKQIALTGGTGSYRNAGGEGTLVEFGNGEGRLTSPDPSPPRGASSDQGPTSARLASRQRPVPERLAGWPF
jgi:hypothetical protein